MSSLDHRLGLFATISAGIGAFLVIVDMAETPLVFENGRIEAAFFAPLVLWLIGRRLHLWPRRRSILTLQGVLSAERLVAVNDR